MPGRRTADPEKTRAAVLAVADWLRDENRLAPERSALAEAVRLTARTLAATAPRTWLLLATGLQTVADAAARGALQLSGARAPEVAAVLPVVPLDV